MKLGRDSFLRDYEGLVKSAQEIFDTGGTHCLCNVVGAHCAANKTDISKAAPWYRFGRKGSAKQQI